MTASTPSTFRHASFGGLIGIARVDITPPVGVYHRNWGAATQDVADRVHRPLSLTALTLADGSGKPPIVLVDADLGWWKNLDLFRRFRSSVLDQLSFEPADLIIALTHTHAAAPLAAVDPELPGGELHRDWLDGLASRCTDVIEQARKAECEALLEWHVGRCSLASNRDLCDPNPESDRYLVGVDPDRPADDTLLLGRISDSSGEHRGSLVNYACHPTTLAWENTAISPDYIGAMRETIEQATGAPAIFLLGACGDLAPRRQYVGDPSIADGHGRQLGYAALSILEGMLSPGTKLGYAGTVESGAPLAIWKETRREGSKDLRYRVEPVDLPLKDWPSADELERQRLRCSDRAGEERLRRKRDIRRGLGEGMTYGLPIHVWRFGDAVLVGCCCEPFSVLQQELRERFPDRVVVVMNLINGSIGYLPPATLYDHDHYAVWQTPFERGCLELTIEAMSQAIHHVISD
ncbi:Neutral/alkaline non-lysosomal ceramidase [Planctomycetes bacterium Pan216]|uniref:Neutral/alkaline non-lysosomal ceramidase n=1 Tax=Kolteria novifilia TaxID=2527975 RepID=A0A518AZW7_9BACT|nr:Neutral/alkaline non-lysosomal ceramidase [Planctomycetes bacterium Pan216]